MPTSGFRVTLTENQSDVLRFLSVKSATVYEMQEQHFRDKTTARLAASANTLVGDGLADQSGPDVYHSRFAITQRGRDWLAEEDAHTATPAPDDTDELRGRLQRAVERLEEKRRDPAWRTRPYERERLGGKIEGVQLALSYIGDAERVATAPRPALAIPVSVVRDFRELHKAMLRDESKPLGKRDGRWAIKVYALTEMLAAILTANGVPGVFEDSPSSVESALRDLFGLRDGDPLPGDENT
jgi:hypothetical protein